MNRLHKSALALAVALCGSIPVRAQESAGPQGGADAATAVAQAAAKNPLANGNKLYEKGDYAAAAEQYRLAARTDKFPINRAFAWFNLGNCHVQAKANNKAIVAYRRSLEEAPTFTRTWMMLGEVYAAMGAVGDAYPCFRRALELDGPNVRAYQMLGELSLRAGDAAEALRNFEAALKLEPNQPDIYLAMAEANARIRDYAAAEKVMEEALLIIPLPAADLYFYLGQLYELGENDRKAVRAYEEGLLIDPKRAEYYMRIANIHERKGDDFLALLALENAVKAGIKKPEIRLKRGKLLFGQARYDKALEEFKAAYDLGSLQGRSGIENIAAVYFNSGNKKKADEVMEAISRP
ncbi:MAG TPA: tetratricopeptide repeat protein [Fibrobacteria bacterium]|nr:tetratricopeptide repeat protein [Fibrobacteria bacterium]